MSQQELLKRIIPLLESLGVEHMLTGSLASSWHGEPRSTHDIDLVIILPGETIPRFLSAFPAGDYYLSEQAVRDAVNQRSMFNLLSLAEGEKVDFWMLTDEPFDRERFARKRAVTVQGVSLNVSSPEDTILVKLRWAKLSGGSTKQLTDALRVYEVQGSTLDLKYLEHWAKQLGVEDLWQRLRDEGTVAGE